MLNSKYLAAAAFTGLFALGTMSAPAAHANDQGDKMEKSGSMVQAKEKHACKGHNSCKGQGADGKNECKGHGSCATDGSKPPQE